MRRFAIQEINDCVRLTCDGVPVCEMLGTHRQKIERAQYLKSSATYKAEHRERRDQEREAEAQRRRYGDTPPRHLDLGGGVHLLAIGTPPEGSLMIQSARPEDMTANYRGLPTMTREEALEWVPNLNQPKIMREAYRKLITGKHLKREEVQA